MLYYLTIDDGDTEETLIDEAVEHPRSEGFLLSDLITTVRQSIKFRRLLDDKHTLVIYISKANKHPRSSS